MKRTLFPFITTVSNKCLSDAAAASHSFPLKRLRSSHATATGSGGSGLEYMKRYAAVRGASSSVISALLVLYTMVSSSCMFALM